MSESSSSGRAFSRRKFLKGAAFGAGLLALGGCSLAPGELPSPPKPARTGRVREYVLEASRVEADLGRRRVGTWGYGGGVPGPEVRATEGDTLRIRVENRLPEETTVHWHGLAVPNDMDGVPGLTQPPIWPGEDFVYEFAPAAGTHLYHSHVGLQLDRGLHGALIIEPKRETLSYDREYVLVLDDWLDGTPGSPEEALRDLEGSGGMGGGMMSQGGTAYPRYLVNGRVPEDPQTLRARRGDVVRMRLINASAQTVFRFAVAGHGLTVTHTDGNPVERAEAGAVRLGMGERYDALLRADNPGVWQVAAAPEDGGAPARALLRYEGSDASPPPEDHLPSELSGGFPLYEDLRAEGREPFPDAGPFSGPDRVYRLSLSGGMGDYEWTIGGQRYPEAEPLAVERGEWVRVEMENGSMMAHPMHLHGHTFQVLTESGRGPYKDTALVEAHMGRLAFDFVADNPGEWFFHCHNAYHMEAGMARVFSYGR